MRKYHGESGAKIFCLLTIALVPYILAPRLAFADAQIDRVYHPYVQALEREFEWRASHLDDDPDTERWMRTHRFAYGQSITEKLFVEAYLLAEDSAGDSLDFEGFELEAKYQLSEQGEYWADWGMLFEVERETSENIWEIAAAALLEKEWGSTSLAANLRAVYEFGGGTDDELELESAFQWRLRGNPLLEPALELYLSDGSKSVGPVIAGVVRLGGNQLKYELGGILGIDDDTADVTYRLMLEFEF